MLKKIQLAAVIGAAAFASAAPAHADNSERCERKLERIEQRFRVIETGHGYEFASAWWNEVAWPKYYARCGG
jgi:hypothetical protein